MNLLFDCALPLPIYAIAIVDLHKLGFGTGSCDYFLLRQDRKAIMSNGDHDAAISLQVYVICPRRIMYACNDRSDNVEPLLPGQVDQ